MEYHIAGAANDPNYADAEAILDDLEMNLPDIKAVKHMKVPADWESFASQLCRKMGFPEQELVKGPIVWAAGRCVGNHIALKNFSERVYGRCCSKDQRDLHMLAQENLRLCTQANEEQEQRKKDLESLHAEAEAAEARVEETKAVLDQTKTSLEVGQKEWETFTEAAQVCLKRLDAAEMHKVLRRSEPKPSMALSKLGKMVVRMAWANSGATTTEALCSDDALEVLTKWVSDANVASPIFHMDKQQRAETSNLARRAVTSLAADGPTEDQLKTPMAIPVAQSAPEGQLENALRAWCRGVICLCSWANIDGYKQSLESLQQVSDNHAGAEAKADEVASAVLTLDQAIKANSDPHDPQPLLD